MDGAILQEEIYIKHENIEPSITFKQENPDWTSPLTPISSPLVESKVEGNNENDAKTPLNNTAYKCDICNEIFLVYFEFRGHRKQHFVEKRTCKICQLICQSVSKLEIHMNGHMGLKPFKCEECSKKFVSKNQLKLHMRSHSDEKRHSCSKCGKAFRHLGSLRVHMIVHNDAKLQEIQCKICTETSPSLEAYRKHLITIHHEILEIQCQLCNRFFSSDRHLQTHLNTHSELKYPCEHCSRIYPSLYRLKRHIKRAHIPNICDECPEIFYDRSAFTKHKKEHTDNKPSSCPHCKKNFEKPKNLSEHIRLQHKEDGNQHQCDICEKNFINASLLRNHVKTHDKSFKCRDCNKVFSSRYNLETHSVTHSGERNHKCEICNKCYSTKTSLKNHIATHTDVSNFKCDLCSKLFKTSRRLYVHKLSHATEEKFECEICKAKFRVKQYLKYHMIKHSRSKPFECKVCNKKFKHKKSWEKHSNHDQVVTKIEMVQCGFCGEKFKGKTPLLEHIRSLHEGVGSSQMRD